MIRGLPRGPFDAYLRAHYFSDTPSVLPRFAMGCGAIFMVQRVAPLDGSLTARSSVAETDPLLLDEMVALVAEQGLEVVALEEARRRLDERDVSARFVAFSFDGAYRSILTSVLPLFEKRAMPFSLFAGSDFLGTGRVPWWLALEALFKSRDRISLQIEGETHAPRWRTYDERLDAFSQVHQRLMRMDSAARAELVDAACAAHGVDIPALARREMLSAEELKTLQAHGLVTIGSLAGGTQALAEMSFDGARDALVASQSALEVATGVKPRALAYPGGTMSGIAARDVRIARELGFEIGLTSIEGALWQEHGRELLALPRIELDNNPATLVRALMLGAHSAGPAMEQARRTLKRG